jgi:hypothetical protein
MCLDATKARLARYNNTPRSTKKVACGSGIETEIRMTSPRQFSRVTASCRASLSNAADECLAKLRCPTEQLTFMHHSTSGLGR